MSKEQNKNIEEKIEGQIELDETPTLAETIKSAVDNGLVAVDPAKEAEAIELGIVDKPEMEKYEAKEGSHDNELKDGECICTCGNHIEKSKVVEIVRAVVDKYNGKVVLAMSEVRDIANAIIAEINK